MLKVFTIIGTRPEIIRLSRIIPNLDKYFNHTLIHTGQNYDFELNQIFFDELLVRKPDIFLNAAGKTAAETIGKIIAKIDTVFANQKPDAILILGDTNSALAAISAKRRKIPIFHMEAGNRSFDQRVPEEINRRLVDHISDINLTYSSIAREYLIREGLSPDQVIKTGSPLKEVLMHYLPEIEASDIMARLGLEMNSFFLVSAHREENIESKKHFYDLITVINNLAEEYHFPVVMPAHPRTKKRIDTQSIVLHPKVRLLKPLSFFEYVNLQMHSKVVLSDSGTITEEASILNFPALNIRECHERPEGMEEAPVMMVGLDISLIKQAIMILEDNKRGRSREFRTVADYDIPMVSKKICNIILSYTGYVNRVVWKKY